MRDVSEESLLDYFHSAAGNSGRVRNADILKTFKPFIGHSDLQLRAKYREEFKLIIDRIAVVKSENGEKYLILKKKYRHLLQERDAKRLGSDADQPRHASPTRTAATAQWETTDGLTRPTHQRDERMGTVQHPQQGGDQHNGEDELGSDSGSKSESEHDEESTGSMGSASVALDPTEKEWIYSAASARVPDLLKLLVQDPSLANKKDFTSGFSHCPVAAADHLLRVALSLCHLHPDKITRPPLKCKEMRKGGAEIKESLNAPQRLHPLKDNLKVIERPGINCRTMLLCPWEGAKPSSGLFDVFRLQPAFMRRRAAPFFFF
ncbi:ankyrin repeat domain-containing protein SOWAHA isoform X3 [Oryzias melastigma]|uniref:ankyrin repeat domain-containing protein SOWAHA isoform X3 n=1 Tax=Oryzias melastigma TaxID=30732 RepID=UPI000CF7C355|nr:ankyrin repeat domain-containing protein SOWAHA isoform X3 [Oryzias melastigma]